MSSIHCERNQRRRLFVGPALLATRSERPDTRMLTGAGMILGGAVPVALFGRSFG